MHTKDPSKPRSPWLLVVRPRLKASPLSAIKRSPTPWLPRFHRRWFSFQQEGKTWLFCPVEIKPRKDTKWVTMDASRCKISPAGVQKKGRGHSQEWPICSKELKELLYCFQKRFHYYPTLTVILPCQSVVLPLVWLAFTDFYCSGDKDSTLLLTTAFCQWHWEGDYLLYPQDQNPWKSSLCILLCEGLRREASAKQIDRSEHQWEGEKRGLYCFVNGHHKVHFPQLMRHPGAHLLWAVTPWYMNPTWVDCDYNLVTGRERAPGTRQEHSVVCGKGKGELTVLSISPWVWNFFKQKIIKKKKAA